MAAVAVAAAGGRGFSSWLGGILRTTGLPADDPAAGDGGAGIAFPAGVRDIGSGIIDAGSISSSGTIGQLVVEARRPARLGRAAGWRQRHRAHAGDRSFNGGQCGVSRWRLFSRSAGLRWR